MTDQLQLRRVFLALLVFFVASCVSTTTPKQVKLDRGQRQLPFRVAVIPVDASEYTSIDSSKAGSSTLLDLQSAGSEESWDALTEHLRSSLDTNVFNDVVVLPLPANGSRADEAYWVHAARAVRADLLLDVDQVRYARSPKNSSIWSSYALFLTGPLEVVFPDRSYDLGECVMDVSLYDVNLMRGVPASREAQASMPNGASTGEPKAEQVAYSDSGWSLDRSALLREFRVRPENVSLRYADRIDGGLGVWSTLKAFFWPTAHIATEGDYLEEQLSDRAALGLATSLSKHIVEGDESFINSPSSRVARFHLREEPRITIEDGVLILDVEVQRVGNARFAEATLVVGGKEYHLDLDELTSQGNAWPQEAAVGGGARGFTRAIDATGREGLKDGAVLEALRIILEPASNGVVEASFSRPGSESGSDSVQWAHLILPEDLPGDSGQVRSWTIRMPK